MVGYLLIFVGEPPQTGTIDKRHIPFVCERRLLDSSAGLVRVQHLTVARGSCEHLTSGAEFGAQDAHLARVFCAETIVRFHARGRRSGCENLSLTPRACAWRTCKCPRGVVPTKGPFSAREFVVCVLCFRGPLLSTGNDQCWGSKFSFETDPLSLCTGLGVAAGVVFEGESGLSHALGYIIYIYICVCVCV